jgi:hypothetical protein
MSRYRSTNHAGHAQNLETLYQRLKSAGLWAEGTRLDLYRKTADTIAEYIKSGHGFELVQKVGFQRFANDLHESHEFIEISNEFPDRTDPALRDRLSKALRGPADLDKETPQNADGRNYLFELVMAGLFKRAGLAVYLDRDEDVSFSFGV